MVLVRNVEVKNNKTLLCFITFWLSKVILRISSSEEKSIFRSLETLNKKLTNAEQHLKFIESCIQHDLLPKFTNIRLHDAEAGNQAFVQRFRKELLLRQKEKHQEDINYFKSEIISVSNNLRTVLLSNIRFNAYQLFISRTNEKLKTILEVKHSKKLCALYNGDVAITNNASKVINLSNAEVCADLETIFKFGMNCHLKTKSTNLTKKIEIEKLFESVKNKEKKGEVFITEEEILRNELKRIGLHKTHDYNKDILTKEQLDRIKLFKENKNIIIRKADKSNTFVIMNRDNYEGKLNAILSDANKF
jgi:archaellum component FlaF (FlaF/FlaG flagellin family)